MKMQTLSCPVNTGPEFDVIVVGGGVSGAAAAIAAARRGSTVLLIEEHGFLGGSLTSMGVGPMMSFHNPAGDQVVRGIPDELIDRLVAKGASPGHIPDTTSYCSTVTPFDSEALKIELETMLREAGGAILYHTQLAAVAMGDDGRIAEIVVCNKAGLTSHAAKVFIDASGDGDLSARAGVPFTMGREGDGASQPMTMNLKLANVDTAAIRAYALAHPEDFLWHGGVAVGVARLKTSPRVSLAGFLKAWNGARERGEVKVPRDQVLFFETAQPGVVIVNTSRITGLDATDPFQLGEAESIGRRQCVEIYEFLRRHAVGFANAVRMDTAAKIGVRESRHIEGRHRLTGRELITLQAFTDVIAMGGYPIDIHAPSAEETHTQHLGPHDVYQIPLRCLLPVKVDNLVVVGRCISATHEASAAFRVTPIAMAIGQAGGVVAAEAAGRGVAPPEVPFAEVQRILREQGAHLPTV
jgi:hypothetical protein